MRGRLQLRGGSLGVWCYPLRNAEWQGEGGSFLPSFHSSRTHKEAFHTNTVPFDDPSWLSHLAQHVKCDELVMFESPCMTDDAIDLVNKVGLRC
jgi:hypothetical protein